MPGYLGYCTNLVSYLPNYLQAQLVTGRSEGDLASNVGDQADKIGRKAV